MKKRVKKKRKKRHILVRLLRAVLAFLGILLAIVILAIALLPTVVSTEYVRTLAESKASEALERDITIQQINWSWRKGFKVSGLSVQDLPALSSGDIIAVDEVLLNIPFGRLVKGRAQLSLSVNGLALNLVKTTNDTLSIETAATPAAARQPEKSSREDLPLPSRPLPLDILIAVDIQGLDVRIEDHAGDLRAHAAGNIGAQFALEGRTPHANELTSISDPPAFIDRLQVQFAVDDIGIDVTMPDGSRVSVGDITMHKPFEYVFIGRTGEGSISCDLGISGIRELPGVEIGEPISISATLAGEHEWIDAISVSQELEITPTGVSQTFHLAAYGLADALKYLPERPLHALKVVGGTMEASLALDATNGISGLFPIATVEGGVGLRCNAKLVPGKSVAVTVRADSPGINVDVDSIASVRQLGVALVIERTLALDFADARAAADSDEDVPLSQSVFETAAGSSAILTPESGALTMQSRMADMHRMLSPAHSLSVGSIRATAAPLPITISNLALDIDLEDNLPVVELLQLDLLGGTIAASAGLRRQKGRYHMDTDVEFSGINMGMIVEDPGRDSADTEAELTGSLHFSVPLDTNITTVISVAKAVVNISHIGSRTLERLLYALDPSGSDETIVAQRRLLKKGSPKWVRIGLRDGALAMQGEVNLLGATIELPSLKRLNVSGLSIVKQHEDALEQMAPVIAALNAVSAGSLIVEPDGRTFTTRGK